jgi:hypothetical protein
MRFRIQITTAGVGGRNGGFEGFVRDWSGGLGNVVRILKLKMNIGWSRGRHVSLGRNIEWVAWSDNPLGPHSSSFDLVEMNSYVASGKSTLGWEIKFSHWDLISRKARVQSSTPVSHRRLIMIEIWLYYLSSLGPLNTSRSPRRHTLSPFRLNLGIRLLFLWYLHCQKERHFPRIAEVPTSSSIHVLYILIYTLMMAEFFLGENDTPHTFNRDSCCSTVRRFLVYDWKQLAVLLEDLFDSPKP